MVNDPTKINPARTPIMTPPIQQPPAAEIRPTQAPPQPTVRMDRDQREDARPALIEQAPASQVETRESRTVRLRRDGQRGSGVRGKKLKRRIVTSMTRVARSAFHTPAEVCDEGRRMLEELEMRLGGRKEDKDA